MEQRPGEREPLAHPLGVGGHALAARLPEPEPLEQHPDPLAPLGNAVEPPVQLEVLERGELPVDERLVADEADRCSLHAQLELRPRSARRDPREAAAACSCRSRFGP